MSITEYNGAVWDVMLTDGEMKALAEGLDPRLIQPDHLVEYWPATYEPPEMESPE